MKTLQRFGISALLMAPSFWLGCDNARKQTPKNTGVANKNAKEDDHSHGDGPNGGGRNRLGRRASITSSSAWITR